MAKHNMGKYEFITSGLCKKEAVIQGEKYRFTVFTPSLIRLEYSEEGYFEDRPTQSVINRDFEIAQYGTEKQMIDGTEWLVIETEKLVLYYDQKAFSASGLYIKVKDLPDAKWCFGQELNDLRGTYRTLDRVDGDSFVNEDGSKQKLELGHGIISREGFSVIDDSKSMALTAEGWVEPRKPCVDLYFFGYGHRYLEALDDFYTLCGSTPLLPRFALGNWWSRYHRYTEAEYKKMVNRFEQEKLPFSVAVIDMDWHLVDDVDPKYGSGWTGYTWNKKFFPDPEGFMSWLHDKNMKVTLNVHPADGIRAFEEIYPKMANALGIDPATEKAIEFDPADPVFMEKYYEILCHDLEKQGVDFWWIDWQQGEESKMPGLDPLWMLNHFHYLDSAWKGSRPMTFSRYAGVGSHRYPVGFSGDTAITWESLEYQPYFTNTASNIGYGWWSHDIGGHMWGIRDDELMARWVQYGVFSPVNRLHSSNNPFSGKEPWKYDATTRDVMNRYLRLRHGMIPYLYTMNRRAHAQNQPMIQPMYYAEPECEEAYQVPNEYYFGSELVVSPITSPVDPVARAAKVKTWLPEGQWADMFTGVVYDGGRMLELWRTVEDMPVLMKAGAIVPMKDMEQYDNSVENPKAMEVHVFPAADGCFTLWEDAGDLPKDHEENWAATDLTWNKEQAAFTITAAKGNTEVIPESRSWKMVFHAVEEMTDIAVTADGENVDVQISYDEECANLIVQLPCINVNKEIKVVMLNTISIADLGKLQAYKILQRSQMDYGVKEMTWNAINKDQDALMQAFDMYEVSETVKACILEVL